MEGESKEDTEEKRLYMSNSVLRASVQTLTVIDGAITTLLLIAVLLIGVLVPTFEPRLGPVPPEGSEEGQQFVLLPHLSRNHYYAMPKPMVPVVSPPTLEADHTTYPPPMPVPKTNLYNSSDTFWWYYAEFRNYQKSLREIGSILDLTFVFMLVVVVASDIALVRGVDLTSDPKYAPRYIYYWLLCNLVVITILPMLSAVSSRIARYTGVIHECGLGCGKPYFYITYRILFGLMVVIFLCQFKRCLQLQQVKGKKAASAYSKSDKILTV